MADPPDKTVLPPPDPTRSHGSSRPTEGLTATPISRVSPTLYTTQGAADAALNQRLAEASSNLDHDLRSNLAAGFPQSHAERHYSYMGSAASVMGGALPSASDHTSPPVSNPRSSSSSSNIVPPPPPYPPPPPGPATGSSSSSSSLFSYLRPPSGKQAIPPPPAGDSSAVRQWRESAPDDVEMDVLLSSLPTDPRVDHILSRLQTAREPTIADALFTRGLLVAIGSPPAADMAALEDADAKLLQCTTASRSRRPIATNQ